MIYSKIIKKTDLSRLENDNKKSETFSLQKINLAKSLPINKRDILTVCY